MKQTTQLIELRQRIRGRKNTKEKRGENERKTEQERQIGLCLLFVNHVYLTMLWCARKQERCIITMAAANGGSTPPNRNQVTACHGVLQPAPRDVHRPLAFQGNGSMTQRTAFSKALFSSRSYRAQFIGPLGQSLNLSTPGPPPSQTPQHS